MTPTKPDTARLREALALATKGRWYLDHDNKILYSTEMDGDYMEFLRDPNDAKFIVFAHNELGAILDYVERLEAENERLRSGLQTIADYPYVEINMEDVHIISGMMQQAQDALEATAAQPASEPVAESGVN